MTSQIDWGNLVTNKSWFEAVIEEQGNVTKGLVESVQQSGLYLKVFDTSFVSEDQVTMDLYLRDLEKLRIHVVKLQARVVQADKRGLYLHFRPMGLSEHVMLRQIIDCMSVYKGSTSCQEEVLLKEKFGLRNLLV